MFKEPDELSKKYDKIIKVVLLGEVSTGKSSLINVYIKQIFDENISPTKTGSYSKKIIQQGDKLYKLNIWDTAGQEKFRSLNQIFIKDSNIVIFTYDITRKSTFNELKWWIQYTESILGENAAVYGVIGNKLDLFDKEKEIKEKDEEAEFELVNSEEGKKFAEEIEAEFLETSAREKAPGLEDFIYKLVEECIEKKLYGLKSEFASLRGDESKSTRNCC